nr:fibrobacter succinogenes major paralogous domain-containing protein [Odoribacter sp.]
VYGYRNYGGGGFNNLGTEADWWSSSVGGTGSWERALNTGCPSVYRGAVARSHGLSVRCVRDLIKEIFAGVVTSYGLNKCA